MATHAAAELTDGSCVNLGIGLPTFVPGHVPAGVHVVLHSENGIFRTGPTPATTRSTRTWSTPGRKRSPRWRGASFFDSAQSFGMIRGGHIDVANWTIPGKMIRGMGGAMDLVHGARRIIALTEHTARDGSPKIVGDCTLPLTGRRCISRINTDLGVLDVTPDGLQLVEPAPGNTLSDVRDATGAPLAVPAGSLA